MKKRILSVLIMVVMLIGMLPTAVFAVETTYGLWVGGVPVTSSNKDNIVVPGATGSATYDPTTNTLTLDNFSYTGEGYLYDSPWCAAIFSKNDLIVKVVGSNTVTASVTDPYTAEALKVSGALTITGDSGSSLTLTGAGRKGVSCTGNLKIEDVTVNATGLSGLCSWEGNITIDNATVYATATGSGNYEGAIIALEKNITIENSKVTATASSGNAISIESGNLISNTCTIKNSEVTISNAKCGMRLATYANLTVENSTLTITATEKAIYAFGGNSILVDNHLVHAGEDAGSAVKVDSPTNATYANKYVKIEPACTVTVNYGVGGVDNKEITVTKGNTISLENPVIDGYIFIGWFTDDTYQTAFDFTNPIAANTTVYAKFVDYEGDKKALQDAIDDLETAVNNVETALNNKVSTDKLTEEVGKLNQAIADAKAYADTQDTALKASLEAADATMNTAITELQNRVAALEAGLAEANGKINTNTTDVATLKNDVSTLKTWQTEAQSAIEALETLTGMQGTNISALQTAVTELQATMNTANGKITAAENRIATLEGKVSALETAKQELEDAVSALQTAVATKADATTVNAAITELQTAINALEAAKNNYIGADDALRTELEGKIANAQNALQAAIEEIKQDLADAKAELDKAIADLDAAMKQGDADLSAEIAAVNTALTNAKAALEKADADNKAELVKKIEDADKILDEAIKVVQKNLDDAKAELDKAIADGDIALDGKITNLNTALNNAVAALKATDSANKAALVAKIKATEATLDAAIKAVQTNLDDAKAELNKAIADGDTALDDKISALNEALATAKAALEATDSANKSELITKIDEADATLKAAIDALSNELNATNEKVAELETFIIIVCVISGVAFCGCGTLAVFYIIDNKKKI